MPITSFFVNNLKIVDILPSVSARNGSDDARLATEELEAIAPHAAAAGVRQCVSAIEESGVTEAGADALSHGQFRGRFSR